MKTVYELATFQYALDLVESIYDLTSRFPNDEKYGLTSQLRRASVSVCSQIAEGQGRLTYGEWRQFLSQARGSLYEVEAQCLIATRLGFVEADECNRAREQIQRTAAALAGLIRWVRAHGRQPGNLATRQPR
jgi:four helix bundle protein